MNNIIKFILIIALQIVNLNLVYAGESKDGAYNEQIIQSYKALYNFNFNTSKEIIDSLKINHEEAIDVLILTINYRWWKIISEDTAYNKKKFLISLDSLKNNMQGFSEEKKKILLIYYYTYYCRYHLMYKNYLKVLIHYHKFDKLIKKFRPKETSHQKEIKLIKNFYLYLKYKHISFDSKRREHYLNKIKNTADSENLIVKTESKYLLMKIYAEIEKLPEKAKDHQKYLLKKYPNNPIFNSFLSKNN